MTSAAQNAVGDAANALRSVLGGLGRGANLPSGVAAVATGARVILPPGTSLSFVLGANPPPNAATPAASSAPLPSAADTAPAAPAAQPLAAAAASQGPPPATAITGVYDGNYRCAQGPGNLKLTLVAPGDGSLMGVFTFDLPANSRTRTASYTLSGRYDAATGRFRLVPVKWESPAPPGFVMVGMEGAFNSSAEQVSGKITYSTCTTFEATRNKVQSATLANRPAVTPAAPAAGSAPANASQTSASAAARPAPAAPAAEGTAQTTAAPQGQDYAQRNIPPNIAQNYALKKKACDFITQSDAESILGQPVEMNINTTSVCSFIETGSANKVPPIKQVHFSVWFEGSPDDYAVVRKNISDHQGATEVVKELPNFSDAAIWRWIPPAWGQLSAFKGGTIRVVVSIRGIPEDSALQHAKALAAGPLDGTSGTGYVYQRTVKSKPAVASAAPPCDVITKAEAEAVVGVKLEPPQLSPGKNLCKYFEPGYGVDASKKKQITIGLFHSDTPDPQGLNLRLQSIEQDKSLLPVVWRPIPSIGDAAVWVWAGGYFGALYVLKGGTTEVAVKISGIPEAAALEAAKRFAARALGGTGKTGFVYAVPDVIISNKTYFAPGILSPLYLGTFSQIPDDEMTRNYVLSLVQAFNGLCPGVSEPMAIMNYGAYYAWKSNTGALKAAAANNLDKAFASVIETLHRSSPHILIEGNQDAAQFLKIHAKGNECLTPPVQRLYTNIAELALERQNLPPDVDDDVAFFKLLNPAMQKHYADGFGAADHPSRPEQAQLQKVKSGCLVFTKGAAVSTEGFCRCQVDAAKESKLPAADLDLLGEHFTQATLTQLGSRNATYQRRKQACYN